MIVIIQNWFSIFLGPMGFSFIWRRSASNSDNALLLFPTANFGRPRLRPSKSTQALQIGLLDT